MLRKRNESKDLRHTGSSIEEKTGPGYYPGFQVLEQQRYWDAATREVIANRVNHVPPVRFFNAAEMATMQAVVDRVLPQDDRANTLRIPILRFIDERLYLNHIEGYRYEDMPSDQDAYRLAATAIEAMAQELHCQAFPSLNTLEQETILQSLQDAAPLAARALWKMNIKRFWSMLVSDCCAVYYAHPFAWDEIGFGGPAYPRGYMRLEGGEAEPWEVDEKRQEWIAPSETLSDRSQQTGETIETSSHGQAGTIESS